MHFHLPKPLHGWREFAGEVGIIVIGVLIALGAEQLMESLRWKREANHAVESIKQEVVDHYFTASEAMVSAPCVERQLELLEQRLTKRGAYMPAPIYSDPPAQFTIRLPDRVWSDDMWRSIVADGIAAHLGPDLRLGLSAYYTQLVMARENNRQEVNLAYRLRTLSQPLDLDSPTRARLAEEVEEERGRVREAALISSQLLRRAEALKLQPPRRDIEDELAKESGTVKFCRAHGLPLGNDTAVF